jgi:geranylgeranyl pyrophosphate synthase
MPDTAHEQLLKERAVRIEDYLTRHVLPCAAREGLDANHPNTVIAAARYALLGGGKRLRAALVYAFCALCGGRPADADPYAAALETVHAYSLIHDDLPCMDDAALRRGKPSCHKAFGEATALLAGDALLTAAFGILAGANNRPEEKLRAVRLLADAAGAIRGMIYGQMLDMAYETRTDVSPEELEVMNAGKTGALFVCACQMGCLAAGRGDISENAARFGESWGLLFQVTDDILDVTALAGDSGKPQGADAAHGKATWAAQSGLDAARLRAAVAAQSAKDALALFRGDTAFLLWLTEFALHRKN